MKILIISYWFLPSSIPNAKRPFYFAEAFLKEGWSVDVIASYSDMTPDQKELLSHPNLNIQRIEDPLDTLCRKLNKSFKTMVSRGFRAVLWPDKYVAWSLRVWFKISLEKYDRVILCLRPESLLLASFKKISKRCIFDCQEAFYPVYLETRRSPIPWLFSPLLIKLQRYGFKKSGGVFFTSNSARKEYIHRNIVDTEKTEYIPLFFDESAYRTPPMRQKLFSIGYFGSFGYRNGIRSPESFFRALKLFLDRNPAARSKTRFMFFGLCEKDPAVIELVKGLELQDVVEMNPPVPYEQYLELLAEASVLLLLVSSRHNLFIPSKMLDYFGAQRPILGFVPFDSETRSMLNDANMGKYVCGEQDVEIGAANIEKLWNKWENGSAPCEEDSKTNQWSASFQTARVLQIMKAESK